MLCCGNNSLIEICDCDHVSLFEIILASINQFKFRGKVCCPKCTIKRLLKERGVTDISELDHEDCLNLLSMLRFDNMNPELQLEDEVCLELILVLITEIIWNITSL